MAERSYEHRTLMQKLGVVAGMRTFVRGIEDAAFAKDLAAVLAAQPSRSLRGTFDAIFAGISDVRDFSAIAAYRRHLKPNGMLWIIAPKGRGTPVPEKALQAAVLDAKLVDVKVCAFSETHTALKAVIRLADRC